MPVRGLSGVARYGLPGLLLGLTLMGGIGAARGPASQAQAETTPGGNPARPGMVPAGDASGTIAFTSPAGGSAQLLYLIDTKTRAFTVYRVDPANVEGTVKLVGARQYQWDLKLTQYNNQQPEVAAIESMVKTLGRQNR